MRETWFEAFLYGKNVLDGFTRQLAAMKIKSGAETSYKRGASDFSAQVARMKADGCDLVVLGTVIRETIGRLDKPVPFFRVEPLHGAERHC
jgi:branched-chain amino acid transport system substrate-binding protein